ncbi:restriction endonuclease subunit S [Paenibacillus sp. TRM 82003]|nr:restriction endonuclease subunit S [Paenibacillus sp. TRM 82003]
MSKTDSSLRIVAAAASMQWNVADMLEAKAEEMEALRDWMLHTARASEFASADDLIGQSAAFHEQLVEMLEGITKLEQGFARHMQLLLEEEEEDSGGGGGGSPFGGLLPFGGGSL